MQFFKGLQGKFLLRFLVLDLAIVAIMVLTVSYHARQSLEGQIKERISLRVRHMSQALEEELEIKWASMKDLSDNSFLKNSVIDTLGRDEYLVPFMQNLSLPGKGGDQVDLRLLDYRGRMIARNSTAAIAGTYEHAPWLSKVLEDGRPHAELLSNDGEATILFAFPIFYLKYPEGILVGEFDLSFAQAIISQEREFQTALLGSSDQLLLGELPARTYTKLLSSQLIRGKPFFFREADALHTGVPVQGLADFKDFAWNLILSAPTQRILAPVEDMRRNMILVGMVTAIFLSSIVLWRSRIFVRPLQYLEGTMKLIMEQGDLSKRVSVASQDEVGALAQTFNEMIANLEQSRIELISARNYNQNVVKSMSNSLVVLNPDLTIRTVNQATLDLLGYEANELIGKPAGVVFSQEFFSGSLFDELMTKGCVTYVEKIYLRKDGLAIPISFSGSVMRDDGGEIEGIVCVAQDLTERKRLEQAEKLAAVGQLAGGVAHEINNPLGVILGFAQGIVKRIKPGDSLEMPVRSIEREAQRCKHFVEDLLTFSRVDKTEKEEVDVNQAIAGALSLVMAQGKVRDVELVKDFQTDLPKILGNKNQIQQVIVNLSNNAMDAMSEGGKLSLRTWETSVEGNDLIAIEVKDTGRGISPEIQPRIFEPFLTSKEVGQGTGLGLSLVYEIIQKHDGKICVESEVGKGTTFFITLPIASEEELESFA